MNNNYKNFKSGVITIIGKPNVGKSTLLNQLIKTKLSIVTPKPQTTRLPVKGILSTENYQIVIIDTPGYLKNPDYLMQAKMVEEIENSLDGCDVILFMIESFRVDEEDFALLEFIKHIKIPVLLVMNKTDAGKEIDLSSILHMRNFEKIFKISALNGEGINELIEGILEFVPVSPPLYELDVLSDQQERFFVAEIIREKIFLNYSKEIPYSTIVLIDEFKENHPDYNNKTYIKAIIFVEKESQKGIIIGKNGIALKKVAVSSRKEIEDFLGKSVYLDIWVKVKKNWRKNKNFLISSGFRGVKKKK